MKNYFLLPFFSCALWMTVQAQQSTIVTAPQTIVKDSIRTKVFLAGSIDMGRAGDWQKEAVKLLGAKDIVIFNPRRPDWNPDWEPVSSDPNFRAQVEWELEALEEADLIIMYLAPGTQSPISLLELGLYAPSDKLRVVCPEGFWRKGNVDIVCEKYDIPMYDSLNDLLTELQKEL